MGQLLELVGSARKDSAVGAQKVAIVARRSNLHDVDVFEHVYELGCDQCELVTVAETAVHAESARVDETTRG